MIQFSLFGIPIFIQPFFWLILALFGGALNINSPQDAIKCALFVLAGFLSVLIHELGHALMMKRYRREPQIILHGFGGVAMSQGAALSRTQSFLMTLAGPAVQIALGLLGLLVLTSVPEFPTDQSRHFVWALTYVSLAWAVLNLIPIFPLDGGQMMAALLGPRRAKITHLVSIGVAGLVIVLSLSFQLGFFLPLIVAMLIWDNVKALQAIR